MIRANRIEHLGFGTAERCCWNCAAWQEFETAAAKPDKVGDCTKVWWTLPGRPYREMTLSGDVCAKHQPSWAADEVEERALRAGLG